MDTSGDGIVTREEFESVLEDKEVSHWFAAMEVDVSEASQLFDVLDDGDGMISLDEFIKAMKLIRGDARGTDMVLLMREVRKLEKTVSENTASWSNSWTGGLLRAKDSNV